MRTITKYLAYGLFGILLCTSANAMTTYGPTKRGDTTWQLAKRFHIKGVSMTDMMSAIQQLNSDAFGGPNGATLSIGQTLQIPTTKLEVEQALQADQAQAEQAAPSEQTPVNPAQQVTTAAPVVAAPSAPATAATPTPAVDSGFSVSIWACVWFVLFVITLALYLRSRWLVQKLRMTHHIVTHRLGVSRRSGEQAPREVSRYNTLGMKPRDPSKMVSGSEENKVLAEVNSDIAAQQYETAEKKLLNGIRQNKMNLDLRMKLLEVYVATNNQSAFSKQAEYLLKHMITESDEMWSRVRNMYLKKWVYDE